MVDSQQERDLRGLVQRVVRETPVLDVHTHLYAPRFGGLLTWGIDELLTYHYLVAEVYRVAPMPYEGFWGMSTAQQADHIWRHLFVERSPISEACRGVVTVLTALGLDPRQPNLAEIRGFFRALTVERYVDRVFKIANVRRVIMTNDPFDDAERAVWEAGGHDDDRFEAALRIDPLLNGWETAVPRLREWGYDVQGDLSADDVEAVRRFLGDWIKRIRPRYMAVSLPPTFAFPEDGARGRLIERCVMPAAREAGIPFAMMIGVRRQVNAGLRLAGDGVGLASIEPIDALCTRFPENRFLVTMLARENQHALCVAARKHPNLLPFGCWWFMNNPSIIDEMTRVRLELLGLSFIPQHSDARVLDQLIYKWAHSRDVIAGVLAEKYADLARAGWRVEERDVRRDVEQLLGGVFERFCDGAKAPE